MPRRSFAAFASNATPSVPVLDKRASANPPGSAPENPRRSSIRQPERKQPPERLVRPALSNSRISSLLARRPCCRPLIGKGGLGPSAATPLRTHLTARGPLSALRAVSQHVSYTHLRAHETGR